MTGIAAVELAEKAWLAAAQEGTDLDPIRRRGEFLQYKDRTGRIADSKTSNVTVRRFGGVTTVTGVQEFRVVPVPALLPMAVQAAVAPVGARTADGWRSANLQMPRRQLPG